MLTKLFDTLNTMYFLEYLINCHSELQLALETVYVVISKFPKNH